ncbi:MAG: hypothetical protein ACI9FZ_001357, partial [Bacteroidia bacterium]
HVNRVASPGSAMCSNRDWRELSLETVVRGVL